MDRRDFLQKTALAAPVAGIIPSLNLKKEKPAENVRLGFIGVGLRGRNHVEQALFRPDVEINAICDIDPQAVNITLDKIKKAGRKAPAVYSKGEEDFMNLVKRDDLDGVLIATPWQWHVPMALASMNARSLPAWVDSAST